MKNIQIWSTIFFFFIKSFIKNPLGVVFKFSQYSFYIISGKKIIIQKVPVLKNLRMVLDLSSHTGRSIFLSGLLGKHIDIDILRFLEKNLKKDSVFFDIGANSGYLSLFASQIASRGSVHAFEPIPFVYKDFLRTIKLNNIQNIKANNVCASDKNGTVKFYLSSYSDVSGIKETSYQKRNKIINSKTITLNAYCQKNNINKVDIIGIDTEGAEKSIIFSSRNLIKKFHPKIIVEFCNKTAKAYGYHHNEIYDFLVELGYKAYEYHGEKFETQPKKDYYEDEDLYFVYGN